jgi:hypothetical protein
MPTASLLPVTEKAWSQTVYDAARWRGWFAYRVLRSTGSAPGFPDLVLIRPPRLVFAELKTGRGRLTKAQVECLALLECIPGAEVYVWVSTDPWEAIEEVLR